MKIPPGYTHFNRREEDSLSHIIGSREEKEHLIIYTLLSNSEPNLWTGFPIHSSSSSAFLPKQISGSSSDSKYFY
jgi:hypothetical protein